MIGANSGYIINDVILSMQCLFLLFQTKDTGKFSMLLAWCQGLRALAGSKSVEVINRVEKGMSAWADPNSTSTIFRNLIHNALKFNNAGGKVEVTALSKGSEVEIRVTDTGIGMSEDTIDNLFELEDRSSTYGTMGEKGVGLGLQLVKEFTKLNNGQVEVESTLGEGTLFCVILPTRQLAVTEN